MSTNPVVERRRRPELVRQEALAAGRRLLLDGGPRAVTLKAVGAALGMTHANLIHHFGSADAFQAALKDRMVQDLTREITAIVADPTTSTADKASIVDRTFEAYGRGGIATLMAWSAVTGAPRDELGLAETTRELVAAVAPRVEGADATARAREIVAVVTLLAFADGLVGASLAEAVGHERDAVRRVTSQLVEQLLRDPQAR